MINLHETTYIREIEELDFCGYTWQKVSFDKYKPPYPIEPTEGEHDFRTCEGCMTAQHDNKKKLETQFNGTDKKLPFPLCCEWHKNLSKLKEFDRSHFANAAEITAQKITYVSVHITNRLKDAENGKTDLETALKDITDYIDYALESFGKMPTGCGEPLFRNYFLNRIIHPLKGLKKSEPRNHILSFLHKKQNPSPVAKDSPDLGELLKAYDKWMNFFPLELSLFADFKKEVKVTFPFLDGEPETNKYTGVTKGKLLTKKKFIKFLQVLTKRLIDTVKLYELALSGTIKNYKIFKSEFSDANLKAQNAAIIKDFEKGEAVYTETLIKWLQAQENYIINNKKRFKKMSKTTNDNTQTRTAAEIVKSFNAIDENGYKYTFQTDKDFKKFTSLLTDFFISDKYALPTRKIKLKLRTKTRTALKIFEIYKEHTEQPLQSNTAFFDVVRTLKPFSKQTNQQIYKLMTG